MSGLIVGKRPRTFPSSACTQCVRYTSCCFPPRLPRASGMRRRRDGVRPQAAKKTASHSNAVTAKMSEIAAQLSQSLSAVLRTAKARAFADLLCGRGTFTTVSLLQSFYLIIISRRARHPLLGGHRGERRAGHSTGQALPLQKASNGAQR